MLALLNLAWQFQLETEFWETAEQPFGGISEIRGTWVALGKAMANRTNGKPSHLGVMRTTRPVFCLLAPHWNDSRRGHRPGVAAETLVSEQPLTIVFECKFKEIPDAHGHTQMGSEQSRPAAAMFTFILHWHTNTCKIIGLCAEQFISDTLGSNAKQSSLVYTKGLRPLTYIQGEMI